MNSPRRISSGEAANNRMQLNAIENQIDEVYSKTDRHFLITWLKGVKKENFHKLFIDADRWDSNPLRFDEREPGYMTAMVTAFDFLTVNETAALTPELVLKVHDLAIDKVRDKSNELLDKGFRKLTDGTEKFGLVLGKTLSEKGLDEFLERRKTYFYRMGENEFYFLQEAVKNPSPSGRNSYLINIRSLFSLRATRPATCRANIEAIISIFEKMPKNTEEQKVRAIVRFLQDLDQLHSFSDGNIRTCLLLSYFLCNQLEIEPFCFTDPNCLDCLGEDELVGLALGEGRENFRNINNIVKNN